MKKVIVGILSVVMVAGGFASGAHAAPPQTVVTGVVTNNHVAVAGASVTALCNGHTETDTTDAHGSYLVSYPNADCPFGSTVKVSAHKGSESGVASNTVRGVTTKLNLAIVNVSIPEYGMIGSVLAGGAGIGVISYMRRRQNQQNQF